MSELERIELLEQEIRKLKGLNENGKPTYSFSKITSQELENLVNIKKSFKDDRLDIWLKNSINIENENILFLEKLLNKYGKFLKGFKEETLKANFIIPIINNVDFQSIEYEISGFYEDILFYETEKFIFQGTTDFLISKGLEYSQKPYFFIQEFKKGKVNTDPEPQLLAELISAIELNNELSMRGAYIVGATWNFVILEKLDKNSYQYFVSRDFNCTNVEDLKGIYKNLVFVKNEIIESLRNKEH